MKGRVEICNKLLKKISEFDRYFFLNKEGKGNVARFLLDDKELFFEDEWRQKHLKMTEKQWDNPEGFTHGGGLWELVRSMRDFIFTGEKQKIFSNYWGYNFDSLKKIHEFAKDLGFINTASFTLHDYDKGDIKYEDDNPIKEEKGSLFEHSFIHYPIQVSKINDGKFLPREYYGSKTGSFVAVRPCAEKYKDKTYLGILLGELPVGAFITHNPETKELKVSADYNPAIFIPDCNEIVFGCGSWWHEIKTPEDLKQITKKDINNVWYVKALKMFGKLTEKKK